MLDDIKLKKDFNGFVDITGRKCFDNGYNQETLSKAINIKPVMIKYHHEWYLQDDGFYFYKDQHIYNELFLSELACEFRIKCVEFFLAKNNDCIGIISKSFRKPENEYYDYLDFANTFFERKPYSLSLFISKVKRKFNEDEANNIIKDICRLIAFDFFTFQNDRVYHNMCFERVNGITRLAPLFDNGVVNMELPYNYYSCIDDLRFPVDSLLNEDAKYVLDLICKNKDLYDGLIDTLNIDVEKVLNRTIEKYGLDIPEPVRRYLLECFDNKKRIIDNTLSLSLKR